MAGSFPPSSRKHGIKRSAQATATLRPFGTLPVKQMRSTFATTSLAGATVSEHDIEHLGELGYLANGMHERLDKPGGDLARLQQDRRTGKQRRHRVEQGTTSSARSTD